MRSYIIRRLMLMIPTLLIASLIIFVVIRLIPGNVIDAMVAQLEMDQGGVVADRAALERELGLDVPIYIQYGRWIGVLPGPDGRLSGVLQGDFGKSLWRGTPVIELIAVRWPVTL
jgi:peptide/nickel transport system permease protein